MPVSHRRHRIEIRRRFRTSDGRHGWITPTTFDEYTPVATVWGAVSPTLGGGRRERQVFGPRIEFEMNAMGLFHPHTDVRVTDMIKIFDDEYEVLAVVNSMYLDKGKFAALKSKPEVPA